MEPSLELVVGLLGILKAGGRMSHWIRRIKERLAFMLSDAQVPVLVTQQKIVTDLSEPAPRLVCLDTDWEHIAPQSTEILLAR